MLTIRVLREYLRPADVTTFLASSHDNVVVSGEIVMQEGITKVLGGVHVRDASGIWRSQRYWKKAGCAENTANPGPFDPCHVTVGRVSIGVLCCLDGDQGGCVPLLYQAMTPPTRVIAIPAHRSYPFAASDPEYRDATVLFCNGNTNGPQSFARLRVTGEGIVGPDSVLLRIP